ncbi:MAG: hypothetical protein ACI9HE_004120, partial [Planctomycetota bacterium]
GQRATWMGLLLPLAERDVALAAAAASGTGVLTGILAMNIGLKLTLGGLLAIVVLLATPLGSAMLGMLSPDVPLPPPIEVAFRPMEVEAEPSVMLDASALQSIRTAVGNSAEPTAAAVPRAGFLAELKGTDGMPVVGARCSLYGARDTEALSDALGRVEILISGNQPMSGHAFQVRCEHSGYMLTSIDARPRADQLVDLGVIVMLAAGTIEGLVFDASGALLEDAWVELSRDQDNSRRRVVGRSSDLHHNGTRTDAQGRFVLDRAPVGKVHLWAGADGHEAVLSGSIEVRRRQISSGVELRLGTLNPEDYITGIVLDPDGQPLPRAKLRFEYASMGGSGSGSTNCDQEGRFRLAYTPRVPRSLRASDRTGKYGEVAQEDVRGGSETILRLRSLEFLELRVIGGGEFEGLEVWGYDLDRNNLLVRGSDVAFEDGVARVPVPAEGFVLDVSAEGHEKISLGPFDGISAPRELSVTLDTLPGINGRVLAGGVGVADASIELVEAATRQTTHNGFGVRVRVSPEVRGKSDAEGHFSLTLRESGLYFLRVVSEQHAPAELGPFQLEPAVGRSGLEVLMSAGGALEGTVARDSGRSALGLIVAISRGDAHPISQRVDRDGRYHFDRLTPGPWQVKLVPEELSEFSSSSTRGSSAFDESQIAVDCIVREGATTRFDLTPGEAALLEGTVRVDGQPLEGAKVQLMAASDALQSSGNENQTTDQDGFYRLHAPEAGSYYVLLSLDGNEGAVLRETIELVPGTNSWNAEHFTGSLRIENMQQPDEQSATRAFLVLYDGNREVLAQLVPNAEGVVTLKHLPSYRGRIVSFGMGELSRAFDPRLDGTTLLEVEVLAGQVTSYRLSD